MILRIKGQQDTYEVIGTPSDNNHLLPVMHKKLEVQKQRKPTKLTMPTPEPTPEPEPEEEVVSSD
jgi:hypothetical protein